MKFMIKKLLIIILLFSSFSAWAEEPRQLLDDAIALLGSGPERNWNNKEIGEKLRKIRRDFPLNSHSLSAAALLAFHLSQVPGDNSKEIFELCDEVSMKAPKSWQAWVANCAKIATWGLREGENQKTLDAALVALAQTNGDELARDVDAIVILKPFMDADKWPPAPSDFTDIICLTISQQALILGKYDLSQKHLDQIVSVRLKERGKQRAMRYLREHPEVSFKGIENK